MHEQRPTLRQKGQPSNSYRMMGLSGRLRNCARLPDTNAPLPSRSSGYTLAVAICARRTCMCACHAHHRESIAPQNGALLCSLPHASEDLSSCKHACSALHRLGIRSPRGHAWASEGGCVRRAR